MKQVQPVLRLAVVLLLAASRGQAKKAAGLEAEAPLQPPRYDFSRYFGAHGGGGGDPGGGFGGGLGSDKPAAAASERDTSAGFVEPVDFKSFFSADSGGGGGFGGQRAASPFFGASSLSANKQSRLPFGSNPFGALAAASSAETDDFGDFSKAKRGAGGEAGQEQQRDDDFFHFDFADGGGTKADLHDEDGEDRDEADDEDGDEAGHSRPLKAANARYPSYSSYYHTQPEQLRAGGSGSGGSANANAEADDDDFGFDDEEGGGGGAAADIRTPSRNPLGASAEAYDSRPFRDASQHTADASAPLKGSARPGPARFSLQGGFVPSPVDPLRTQASQEQAAKAAQSSKAASHAAVHAAVRAAHQAAASHGKTAAAAGTGLGLGANPLLGAADVAGLGPVMRTFVRRTREEPDDAFFEAYNDGDEKEGDDYRFGPEHFGDEDEDDESPRGKQAAEAEDDGEAQQSAAATPGSCKKVKKKGSVCMVCADPKTGGNYEQCQYATEPETQSYSFGRSSSYGNPRGKTRRRRRREEGRHQQEAQDSSLEASLDSSQDTSQDTASKGSQRQQDAAGETGDVAEAQDGPAAGVGVGLDSHEEDHAKIQEELDRSLEQLQGPKYEDYFSFLFPELAKEKEGEQVKEKKSDKKGKKKEKKEKKSKKVKKKAEEDDSEEVSSLLSRLEDDDEDPFAAGTSAVGAGTGPAADLWLGPPESAGAGAPGSGVGVVPKKDLERMLGEFQQKDRSDCTKVEKDKMTCYQCVDKKGMQHEECMFVAASEPKQSHVAYHQSSAFKQPGPPPKADGATAATATATTTAGPPRTATARAAASSNAPSAVAAPAKGAQGAQGAKGGAKSRQQRAAEPEKAEAEADDEADDEKEELHDEDEEVVEPEGLGQGPDDGMFTEETKPVYDRALKMSLPKYMLDRSENERVFDEVLASGV